MIFYLNSFIQKIIILIVFTILLVPLSHSNEKQNKSNNSSAKVLNILNELEVECKTTGDKEVCNRYDNLHEHVHKKTYLNTSITYIVVKCLIIIFAIIGLICVIKKIINLRKK